MDAPSINSIGRPWAPRRSVVNAAHLQPFVRLLRSRAIDPELCLSRLDWPPRERSELIPASIFCEFLRLCRSATEDEALGLHAGEHARLEDLNLLGLLLRSVPLGRDVCDALQRYHYLIDPIRDADLCCNENGIRFVQLVPSGQPMPRAWGEYFAARTVALAREIAGAVTPIIVRFMHPRPPDLSEYRRLFGAAALHFDCRANEVVFASALLDSELPRHDDVTVEIIARHLKVQCPPPAKGGETLVARVKAVIVKGIASEELSAAVVARALNQSERTLRRQLHAHGTSYQTLLDQTRLELAQQYLASGLSKAEVSARIGFGEPGSFYRALKRWTYRHDNRDEAEQIAPSDPSS